MEVKIRSWKGAEKELAFKTGKINKMISIADAQGGPRHAPYGAAKVRDLIRLVFDDTEARISIYQPPVAEDIKRIIDFARKIEAEKYDDEVLIHCEAGISRSSAAAVICFAVWMGAGKEKEAIDTVYKINLMAMPNKLMVALADELLDRKGALIQALKDNPEAGDFPFPGLINLAKE